MTDMAEIRTEIENRTDVLTDGDKGISKVSINLKIYSPDFLNLTLVDLPGLIQNPTGSQPKDIEKQLKDMIKEYISKENCLILAVSPANDDLANSSALKLAREVDPEGERTIGVLTKLDIVGAGTNARDIFEGKDFFLPRGYVGIVSRSQEEIDNGKSIAEAIKKEKLFFESHESYRHLAHQMGTKFLQHKLNADLAKHIREKLPKFREDILDKKKEAENTLKTCPKLDQRNGGLNELHR
jgi:replication fork clamp-binding protein CrfC